MRAIRYAIPFSKFYRDTDTDRDRLSVSVSRYKLYSIPTSLRPMNFSWPTDVRWDWTRIPNWPSFFLLPDDDYSCDAMRGIPTGRKAICQPQNRLSSRSMLGENGFEETVSQRPILALRDAIKPVFWPPVRSRTFLWVPAQFAGGSCSCVSACLRDALVLTTHDKKFSDDSDLGYVQVNLVSLGK